MSAPRVLLASAGHDLLFTHAVLWGAGLIAEAAGHAVRLGWEASGLRRAPLLTGVGGEELAAAVHERAKQAVASAHWVQAALPHESGRALFSPRVKPFSEGCWPAWESARSEHLDGPDMGDLDRQLIAGLGEPSAWHQRLNGDADPDRGASRLEMQPRNQGSEFVGTRLRALAVSVADRAPERVLSGLLGASCADEAGKDQPSSRSAANLMPPQVTDNALAWVAMWGLGATSVVHLTGQPSRTATHLPWPRYLGPGGEVRAGHIVAPLWRGSWSTARLRAVLTSRQLSDVAVAVRDDRAGVPTSPNRADEQWLNERRVEGAVLFPIHTFGSPSSPERRAMAGQELRIGQLR